MTATGDSANPHRIVRSFAILLGGVVGVVLGLTILTALARPAGAASLPPVSSAVSVPAVSVPAVSVPAVSVPAVSVPGVSVPAVSVPAVPVTGTQPVPTIASLSQEPTSTAKDVPGSVGSIPATVATTTDFVAAPVVAAGGIATNPLTAGLGVPILPLVGGSAIGASGPSATPPLAVGASQAWGDGNAATTEDPIYALEAFVPRPGSANPSAPTAPAPHPAPPTPYPSTSSFLAVNDTSGDSGAAQGGSPFGALPPSDLVPAVLALGAVLLLRGTRPRLLLDLRCSPPG